MQSFTFWMISSDWGIPPSLLYSSCLLKNWDHLGSLTEGFTKHNNTSAAFTTLELDSISTELATVRQAQNKPTYLYNYGGVSSLNRVLQQMCRCHALPGVGYNVHAHGITEDDAIIEFREMYMWLIVWWWTPNLRLLVQHRDGQSNRNTLQYSGS